MVASQDECELLLAAYQTQSHAELKLTWADMLRALKAGLIDANQKTNDHRRIYENVERMLNDHSTT